MTADEQQIFNGQLKITLSEAQIEICRAIIKLSQLFDDNEE